VSQPVQVDTEQIEHETSGLLKNKAEDSKQPPCALKIVTLAIITMVLWVLQDQLYLMFAEKYGGVNVFQKQDPKYQLWHNMQEWQLHVYEKYENQFQAAHCGTYWTNVYGCLVTYMFISPPASGYSALRAIAFRIFSLSFVLDPFSVGPVGFHAIKIMVTTMLYTEFKIDVKRCMYTGLMQFVLCSGIMRESECWLRYGMFIMIFFRIYETMLLMPWLVPWCRMMCNLLAPAVEPIKRTVAKNGSLSLRKMGIGIWKITVMLWTLVEYVGIGLDCMFINRHENVCIKKRQKKAQ